MGETGVAAGNSQEKTQGADQKLTLLGLFRDHLWAQVIAGLVLGVVVGLLMGPDIGLLDTETASIIGSWLALPGELFLAMLQFIVVPLVVASVAVGIAGNPDLGVVRRLGVGVVLYFLITTSIAVTVGVGASTLIRPGDYVSDEQKLAMQQAPDELTADAEVGDVSGPETIISLIPTNPVENMAEGDMLQIVIAAAIFGLALVAMRREESTPLVDFLSSVQGACMTIVIWLMKFAPIAVFGLIADITARVGMEAIQSVGAYVATVLIALLIMLTAYMIILRLLAGRSPLTFLRDSREVMLIAFSTSSSSATMPVTLRTVEERHNISPTVGRLVVPLGATINMDGTALYQAAATVFLAQVYGIEFGLLQLLTVLAMSIGASIGTPGVPGVGIVVLASILMSVGVPKEGIALILAVDRILDMCRTTLNVTGDMVATATLERVLGIHKFESAAEAKADGGG